jgi:hypothetical protein
VQKLVEMTTIYELWQELTPMECCRPVAHNMTKCIQIIQVMSANMTRSTKILAVNRKKLANNIIDPLFLWYLWVDSVKAEPQWAEYPNPCVRSFVRSEKSILEFSFVSKMVQYIDCLFACTHNALSSRLPLGCACNLLPPQLPGAWQGRLETQ